jgi:hypothetical protein
MRKGFWQILRLLPVRIRSAIIRSHFYAPVAHPVGLEFKVADTKQELEEAFALLYAEYLAYGYMDSNSAKLRITKYHALPGTTVLVGKWDGKVVCTLSVITDSTIGLPSDSSWDLNTLRKRAGRIAEISGLAIHPDLQGRRGKILLPMCKFMYEFCSRYAQIDIIFISTLEIVKEFYQAVLLFESIGKAKPLRNNFVKNVVAYGQFLDLRTAPERYYKTYHNKNKGRDLHKYMALDNCRHFQFPQKVIGQCTFPVMTPDLLEYFFQEKLPIFSEMISLEKCHVSNCYKNDVYSKMLKLDQSKKIRKEPRIETNRKATLIDSSKSSIQNATVIEISNSHLVLKMQTPVEINSQICINVDIGNKAIKLRGISIRIDKLNRQTFKVVENRNKEWREFLDNILLSLHLRLGIQTQNENESLKVV